MVMVKCEHCGKEFNKKPANIKARPHHFCCPKCVYEHRSLNLQGQKIGKLTVLHLDTSEARGERRWICRCDCGNHKSVLQGHLTRGTIQSCGCKRTKHNLSRHPLFKTWQNMKDRCNNDNCKNFCNYGARGISICDEWSVDFMNFYNWAMTHGYSEGLSLDRINNDGNYEPSNCRWTTALVQQNNTRHNRKLAWNGQVHTVAEWARLVGISQHLIYHRLSRAWSVERALTTPVIKKGNK